MFGFFLLGLRGRLFLAWPIISSSLDTFTCVCAAIDVTFSLSVWMLAGWPSLLEPPYCALCLCELPAAPLDCLASRALLRVRCIGYHGSRGVPAHPCGSLDVVVTHLSPLTIQIHCSTAWLREPIMRAEGRRKSGQ